MLDQYIAVLCGAAVAMLMSTAAVPPCVVVVVVSKSYALIHHQANATCDMCLSCIIMHFNNH